MHLEDLLAAANVGKAAPPPGGAAAPRARRTIEAAFSARYAPEVLAALKRRAIDAAASAPAAPAAVAAAKPASGQSPEPPTAFYQGLLDRLIKEQPVADALLAQLALRRAEAIVADLVTAGGVPAARSTLGKPQPATHTSDEAVALRLELEATP